MTAEEIREKFLKFFEKNDHKRINSSSLIPESDPSVLLTTAGMQQFKQYFSGERKPPFTRATSIQKCFRATDIEQVGDRTHLTFFEMLGNFSFGDYYKKEAVVWALEFLEKLGISRARISFSVFAGDKNIPKDEESLKILKSLGFDLDKIELLGAKDNFWGPTGLAGPCGPTIEIYVDGLELWNLVFNEYYQKEAGSLTPLKPKGVDTGMGLERLVAILQNTQDVYQTELYQPILNKIKKLAKKSNIKSERIIADHIRGIVFLVADDILPSNIERGYVLRRLIRRAVRHGKILGIDKPFLIDLAKRVIKIMVRTYPELTKRGLLEIIEGEEDRFNRTVERGLSIFEQKIKDIKGRTIRGKIAFELYDTYGFPLELTEELAAERKLKVDIIGFKKEMKKQKERARKAGEAKKRAMASLGSEVIKNHTATHLLHQTLRDVLGPHVMQKGQDLTAQRLRFDFSHPKPLTSEQLKKVEEIVNQKIREALPVRSIETTVEEAKKMGALALFESRYGQKVTLYDIGGYSKELCAGPHVKNTAEIGSFRIIKEQSSGAGIRRIKAVTG